MANILHFKVDFRVYKDSEPWLYNELVKLPARARARYLINAASILAQRMVAASETAQPEKTPLAPAEQSAQSTEQDLPK